jgi:hypothetical protein
MRRFLPVGHVWDRGEHATAVPVSRSVRGTSCGTFFDCVSQIDRRTVPGTVGRADRRRLFEAPGLGGKVLLGSADRLRPGCLPSSHGGHPLHININKSLSLPPGTRSGLSVPKRRLSCWARRVGHLARNAVVVTDQDQAPPSRRGLCVVAGALPVDDNAGLVADDPGVMAGGHDGDVVRTVLHLFAAVGHDDSHPAGDEVAGMGCLAGLCSGDRLHVFGPAPAWLEDGPSNRASSRWPVSARKGRTSSGVSILLRMSQALSSPLCAVMCGVSTGVSGRRPHSAQDPS